MDIRPYLAPILKWWWLLLGAAFLAAGTSYYIIRNQPQVFTSSTTLIIGRTLYETNPSTNDFWLNEQLNSFYRNMLFREPVQEAVKEALGMDWLPQVVAKPLGNNQFIQINVIDTIPERAKMVAAEFANQLVKVSPSAKGIDSAENQFTEEQIKKTQEQIVETEEQINAKQTELAALTSAHEIDAAEADLNRLLDKLDSLRTTYANLISRTTTSVSNVLEVIEPASLPLKPTGPNHLLIVAIAGLAGLVLGVGTAYLLEYLDEAVQNPEELAKAMDVPIVGYFADLGRKFSSGLFVARHPRSLTAEAFRTLRANIELQNLDNGPLAILITSPDTGDGKTSVAVNLAVSFAQGGKKVILVDGDLRKPSIHSFFDVQDRRGLTDLLRGGIKLDMALRKWDHGDLRFITVGDESVLPDLLLTPDNVSELVSQLKEKADVIIFDSSPFLVSDAMIFAAKVDGVLVVIRPGYTSREMAKIMKERIGIAGGKIMGLILNRIPLRRIGYYGNYRYYMPYEYYDKAEKEEKLQKKSALKNP